MKDVSSWLDRRLRHGKPPFNQTSFLSKNRWERPFTATGLGRQPFPQPPRPQPLKRKKKSSISNFLRSKRISDYYDISLGISLFQMRRADLSLMKQRLSKTIKIVIDENQFRYRNSLEDNSKEWINNNQALEQIVSKHIFEQQRQKRRKRAITN